MARGEGDLVKAPHKKQTFTTQQMREFAACCDPVTGPEYFMRHFFYIQHPTKGQILYEPYGYQVGLIDTYHSNRFAIALMPRQTGKCVTGESLINIRNNTTGKVYDIPIERFYEYQKAIANNECPPDIEQYKRIE